METKMNASDKNSNRMNEPQQAQTTDHIFKRHEKKTLSDYYLSDARYDFLRY